jgi:hypothetical protein
MDSLEIRPVALPSRKTISVPAGRKLLERMKTGQDFHYQKVNMEEMRMAVVTELGLPVTFQLSVPWAVRLEGNANMDVENKTLAVNVDMM